MVVSSTGLRQGIESVVRPVCPFVNTCSKNLSN